MEKVYVLNRHIKCDYLKQYLKENLKETSFVDLVFKEMESEFYDFFLCNDLLFLDCFEIQEYTEDVMKNIIFPLSYADLEKTFKFYISTALDIITDSLNVGFTISDALLDIIIGKLLFENVNTLCVDHAVDRDSHLFDIFLERNN